MFHLQIGQNINYTIRIDKTNSDLKNIHLLAYISTTTKWILSIYIFTDKKHKGLCIYLSTNWLKPHESLCRHGKVCRQS